MIHVVGCGIGIKMRMAIALKYRESQFVPFVQMVSNLPRKIFVSVAIPVGIVPKSGEFCRVKTSALEIAEIQAEVRVVDGAVDAAAHTARAVRSNTRGNARCGRVLPALGEDLYDPAYGVGTVQAAQLTGDDLDAFDLVERNVFKSGRTRGSGIDPHAVHQNQRLIAVRTTHEYAADLSESAIARNFDSAQRLQHLHQRLLTASSDVLGRDDVDRLQGLRACLRKAGRRDHHGVFGFLRPGGGCGARAQRRDDGAFHGFPFGQRPRRPGSSQRGIAQAATGAANRCGTATPRYSRPIVPGRSPGLWDRAYRLPASWRSQWLGCRPAQSAGSGRWVDTPAHTHRCGGSRGFGDRKLLSPTRGIFKGAIAPLIDYYRTSFPFHTGARHAPEHLERAR